MENQKKQTGKNVLIVILVLAVLGLGGFIIYDKFIAKETKKAKEPVKSVTKEDTSLKSKENLDEVASILIGKLDKYFVDYYDSKESVDFMTLSENDKMLGAYSYNMRAGNSLDLKSMVDDYYNNLFGITLTSYPDINCWAGDGALFSYNSANNKYERVGNHGHGGLTEAHSALMKYNNIEKSGDNYTITVTKVYAPSQGVGLESPENAFYADHNYTVKLDALTQFTGVDSSGLYVTYLNAAKNYYEQNYEQFKNIKPQYRYTFSKNNNDYYLKSYQIIK